MIPVLKCYWVKADGEKKNQSGIGTAVVGKKTISIVVKDSDNIRKNERGREPQYIYPTWVQHTNKSQSFTSFIQRSEIKLMSTVFIYSFIRVSTAVK